MDKKKIILDFDDVIVPTLNEAIKIFNAENKKQLQYENFTSWDVSNIFDDNGNNFATYFHKIDFTKIKEKNNAIKHIKRLNYNYDIYIATASCVDKFKEKEEWVRKNLPFFDINKMLLCRNKSLLNAYAIIDDGEHNLRQIKAKYKFKYDMPHNKDVKYINCRNLKEFMFYLKCLEEKGESNENYK